MGTELLLSEYLQFTTDFEQDPTPEKYNEITDWLGKIEVRDYIPMKEKELVMMDVLAGVS